MPRVVVFNLGCKVNQYECDALLSGLAQKGYEICSQLQKADIYIINTCAVTAEAERKSRQIINRIKRLNPNADIKIIGCASQKSYDFYIKSGIDYIGGTANKLNVLDSLQKPSILNKQLPSSYEEFGLIPTTDRCRAFIKIQDGCDNRCSYCIIPLLRGASRSRKIDDVINEVEIVAKATNEIVLTGINLSYFGKENGQSLEGLIAKLANFDIRIRLGSMYMEIIDERLLDGLFSLKKFCPHFHLSLQHGDNDVLKDMNRKYSADEYYAKLQLIRKYDQNAAITTDIIVGYPTENEQKFENMLQFVDKCQFADIHIFPFSKREGTAAYSLPQLNASIIANRKRRLMLLKEKLKNSFLSTQIGKKQHVLFENDGLSGYSRNYVRVYSDVPHNTQKEILILPTCIHEDGLKGEFIDG